MRQVHAALGGERGLRCVEDVPIAQYHQHLRLAAGHRPVDVQLLCILKVRVRQPELLRKVVVQYEAGDAAAAAAAAIVAIIFGVVVFRVVVVGGGGGSATAVTAKLQTVVVPGLADVEVDDKLL